MSRTVHHQPPIGSHERSEAELRVLTNVELAEVISFVLDDMLAGRLTCGPGVFAGDRRRARLAAIPPGEGSERFALELEFPMAREPKTARYTIRRDALGWSVIDAMTGKVAFWDRVTLTVLDAEDADDIADGLSWIARRDEERRNGPG